MAISLSFVLIDSAYSAFVPKNCINFFQLALESKVGKATVPVECQYYRFQDLDSDLQKRVRETFSKNKIQLTLDQKLSSVAGLIISFRTSGSETALLEPNVKNSHKIHNPDDLIHASSEGDLTLVEQILREHPSAISERIFANSLKWAAYNGHLEVLRRLLKAGASPYYVFHDSGGDRGPDMDVIQWLEFNRSRCGQIGCVGWDSNSASNIDRALDLLRR